MTDGLTADDLDHVGSIDYVVIEFDGKTVHGELLPDLFDLVDQGIIRLMDVMFVVKSEDGEIESITTADMDEDAAGKLAGASSGVFDADDVADAASVLRPGATGLVLMYENLWSLRFAEAAREAGGLVVSRGHIDTQTLAAVLDELEAETRS